MNQLDRDIHAEARRAHEHVFNKLLELKQRHTSKPDLKELVDSVYALKEAYAALTDVAKEVKRLYELLERLTCMGWTVQGDYEPIRTAHCTGSPDVKQTVITPKHGTPEYEELRKHFGIPDGVPFRPHWPSMLERISSDLAAGKNIPPGCDPEKMLPQYRVTIRNKKGVEPGQVSDPHLLRQQYDLFSKIMKIETSDFAELFSVASKMKVLAAEQEKLDEENKISDVIKPEQDDEEDLF